jgi:hypothetical protein
MQERTEMMLTDDAGRELVRLAVARVQRRRDEKLHAAKAEAARRGKEPFDLAKLETMCDTSHEGRVPPLEERQKEHEWMYYTQYREVMTLAEYAEKVTEQSRW